jgi:hypothetical protein
MESLTEEEFYQRWEELWGYPFHSPFQYFADRAFMEIESYEPDWDIYQGLIDDHPEWYFHTEEELRERVGAHLQILLEAQE